MSAEEKWAYTIEVKLVKGQGTCAAGHKVGDTWVFPGDTEQIKCDRGLCLHALASMFPKFVAMRYGAQLPWLKETPDVATHVCPDAANPHVFELRRRRT